MFIHRSIIAINSSCSDSYISPTLTFALDKPKLYVAANKMTPHKKIDAKIFVAVKTRCVIYSHLFGQEGWYETDLKKQT